MPSLSPYRRLDQVRVPIAAANTWVPITIPVGAVDALIQVEDRTVPFRLSSTNAINPATEGNPVAANGAITMAGNATEAVIFYVSASAPTTAVALFQLSP